MGSALEEDRNLLEGFRRGERPALEQVYWAYVARVDRLVRRILRVHGGTRLIAAANVEDLVHESFTRAFSPTARQAYDGIRDYGPYLLTIVRNTVAEHASPPASRAAGQLCGDRVLAGTGGRRPGGGFVGQDRPAHAGARVRDYLSKLPLETSVGPPPPIRARRGAGGRSRRPRDLAAADPDAREEAAPGIGARAQEGARAKNINQGRALARTERYVRTAHNLGSQRLARRRW